LQKGARYQVVRGWEAGNCPSERNLRHRKALKERARKDFSGGTG